VVVVVVVHAAGSDTADRHSADRDSTMFEGGSSP